MGGDGLGRAIDAIGGAKSVLVSPISLRDQPESPPRQMAGDGVVPDRLPRLLEEQGGAIASLDPDICVTAGVMAWPHRDPFDRLWRPPP